MELEPILELVKAYLVTHGPRLLAALVILFLGLWFSRIIARVIIRVLRKREVEESLLSFLKSFIGITLKILVIITFMSMVGVAMTSFIAILGAAGLAVGLALQGSLSNFAGGVLILLFKPFKVGEFIEAQGFMGSVKEIQMFNTVLYTPDNKRIVIPNGALANNSITNFSSQDKRRAEWVFGVAYGTSYDEAEKIILDVIKNDPRILTDPEPFVGLKEMADSSVNIITRAWIKIEDFWPVYWDMNKTIYKTFNEKGIEIPFPQVDVHMKSN